MNSYMTTYRYPAFLAQAALKPKAQITEALTRYINLSKEERSDAVHNVHELEEEALAAGLPIADAAKLHMVIYWG